MMAVKTGNIGNATQEYLNVLTEKRFVLEEISHGIVCYAPLTWQTLVPVAESSQIIAKSGENLEGEEKLNS